MVPVTSAVAVMIASVQYWNPVVIALFAAIGGTIGELSDTMPVFTDENGLFQIMW